MLSGDNGILQRATQSKEKTERAEIIETAQMDVLGKQTENQGEISEKELKDILIKYGTLSEDEENILDKTLTTIKGSYEIAVSEIYNGELKPPKAGLYNAETDELIYSWDKLLELGNMINVNNGSLSRRAFTVPNDIAKVKLVITDDGTVTNIGGLQGISKLKEVVIPSIITNISDTAFSSNQDLTTVNIASNNTISTIGSATFASCKNLTNIKIPNSVTTIGSSAFAGCTSLTSLVIPESVTSIGAAAFDGCSSLRELTICGKLTSFIATSGAENPTATDYSGPNSLKKMASLKKITLGSDDVDLGLETIPLRAFQGFTYVETVEIKPSVKSIGDYAFISCNNLQSINMSNRLSSIGSYAFSNCSNLESISIPDSVSEMGENVFNACSSLTSVTISSNLQSISNFTFNYCSILKNITIPENITSIGNYAFQGCTSLESIIVNKTNNSISGAPWGAPNMTSNDVVWNE